jgi:hypothetical protein
MTPVDNSSKTFEVLKRLNGVYILIFHFAQTKFKFLVKKKFGNYCRKTVPKVTAKNAEVAGIPL